MKAYQEYRRLRKNDIEVQEASQIRFNSGSESLKHKIAKTIVSHIGQEKGYHVGSEVTIAGSGEADIVLWGHPERQTYVVEVETSPTQDTMNSKKNRYIRPGIDDMLTVNVTEMPPDYFDAQAYVREELGL